MFGIPGFAAESAVYKSTRQYQSGMPTASGGDVHALLPAGLPTRCVGLYRCCGAEVGGICFGSCCSPNLQCCPDGSCSTEDGSCCGPLGQPCGPECCNTFAGESCCHGFTCCNSFLGQYCDPWLGCIDTGPGGGGGDGGIDGGGWGDGGWGDGGDGGDGCFVEGTLVAAASGFVPINEIELGDKVMAYDLENRKLKRQAITKLYRAESEKLLVLDFGIEPIRCTPQHRFFNGDWVSASDLRPGDSVLCRDGHWQTLLSVNVENEHRPVFNLRVQQHSNYFVGSVGLLVHNLKIDGGFLKTRANRTSIRPRTR
jgi:hypothetical protein